jgi:hypothetical protein
MRKSLQERKEPWTVDDLKQFGPPTIADRKQWKLSASHNGEGLAKAVDGNLESRYDTHKSQTPDMWVAVELPKPTQVAGVRLDPGKSAGDYPRGYAVEVSKDGKDWTEVAKGEGKPGVLNVKFDACSVKALRIRQTGSVGSYWSIHELDLLAPEPKPLAQK